MAKEYIEREEAKEKAYWHGDYPNGIEAVDVLDIDAIPAADVVERKRGEWVKDSDGDEYCSICSRYMPVREVTGDPSAHDFCPNCGADMRSHQNILCDQGERRGESDAVH